ncbi:MAG: glycoside hydrolase family 31 protein [Opitutaceae bacterium]|nr:glycoside hydrolase family 31 protein [Opitutaceae bacterium]
MKALALLLCLSLAARAQLPDSSSLVGDRQAPPGSAFAPTSRPGTQAIAQAARPGPPTTHLVSTPHYQVRIADPGFRLEISTAKGIALPADASAGLFFAGHPAVSSEEIYRADGVVRFRVTNQNGQTALAELQARAHTLAVTLTHESGQPGPITLRTGSPGPAYGLGDLGAWEPNANLATEQKTYPIRHDGGRHRWLSSFLIFPRSGVAGACFERQGGEISIGPESYGMSNRSAVSQRFYYFVGSMEEIYAAWREVRIAEGYPGVAPQMDGFELGFETWDRLRWHTNAATAMEAIQQFLDNGYRIRWAVTGSGFWQPRGTTTSFGRFDAQKYPDTQPPLPPDFGDWCRARGIRWLIGQRINFVPPGGPFSSKPGESGASIFDTSPNAQEGIAGGYFLKDASGDFVKTKSKYFPTVPCLLLDGNVPGAAAWFKNLYDQWGVDGVKEDTMMAVPDHTIFNAPMHAIAASGDLVMDRCGAYTSPGTLTRIEDTFGAKSMTLRSPINYLQLAASAAPNVYSDTLGFGGMGNVTSTLRHAWMLALTAGMAVSDSPWHRNWSDADQAKLKKAVDFHYQIGPYLHSSAVDSHATGYPHTLTPLPIAFPDDPATHDLASSRKQQFQWMIGPSLLAAPLLHDDYASSHKTNIYLPAGTWIDIGTGDVHTGPKTLTDFELPLDKIPVFVGGKGVYVARLDETSPLQAVVFPIATGGSRYTFTHPDGLSTSTVVNDNTGWNRATLKVTNTHTGADETFTVDPCTGAIRFNLLPGHAYTLSGGQ